MEQLLVDPETQQQFEVVIDTSATLSAPWDARLAPSMHEAGHVVVAHRLGVRIECVYVLPDGSGRTDAPTANVEQDIQIRLSGGIAEERYCTLVGLSDDPGKHPMHGKHDDEMQAFQAAKRACDNDLLRARALVDKMRPLAEAAIDQNWDSVVRIALLIRDEGNVSIPILYEALNWTDRHST